MLAKKYGDYGKLVCIYDLENRLLIKDMRDIAEQNPRHVLCFKIEDDDDFKYNDLNISYENFPWKTYYKINRELVSTNPSYNAKYVAWNHWINYGMREERAFSFINNTNDHRARLGNLFFLNMCLHLFSKKYDLKSSYKYEKEFKQLGLLFHKGNKLYSRNLLLTDYNFEDLLDSDVSAKNIIINNNVWFHTNRFCNIIREYFIRNNWFARIRDHNIYKSRYSNNNDLFIHVRLGDVTDKTSKLYGYYNKVAGSLEYNRGYISSDNIRHDICQKLIRKYKLEIVNKTEVETIMFSSTCKHLVLTGGTFSWLMGFFALENSRIFYPDIKEKWYGDIFRFSNWKKVDI